MELTKISVIALSFGLLCNAAKPPILPYHDFRRSVETTPASSNCICLPKVENAQLLPDIIGGEGIDLERLVIYFYINPQTKKITAYTPNMAKQQIFSDLSFEVGDELQPIQSYENINNIVILNPNKIERTRGRQYINSLTIDENQNPREFITSTPTDSVNIAKDENISVIGPHEENIIGTNEVLNILPSHNNAQIHFHPNANMEVKDNINLVTLNKQNILNQLLPAQESGVTSIQNINHLPENIAHAWQTHSINDYNVIWNNNILKDEGHHLENAQDIQRPGNLNFDTWFKQQMDSSINKQMQNNVNFPDDEVLKNHVYNKLFQNGIISMGNGKFKTHQGDILNLSNLKLQPILVGLSLGYNHPTPGSHGEIVHPYFDAMALYMNNPLKVLGIIPISSVYNPESMGYITTNLNKYPSIVTSTLVKTNCVNDKCHTNTMAKKSPWRASRLQKKETVLTEYNMNDRSAQDSGNNANLNYNNRLHYIKQLENMQGKMKSKHIPVINDVSKKLSNILVGDKDDKIAGKKTPKYDVRTTEDEGPDTRILGGSAATGSGTPISIRGRSAFD